MTHFDHFAAPKAATQPPEEPPASHQPLSPQNPPRITPTPVNFAGSADYCRPGS
jgi:hypothetical protein